MIRYLNLDIISSTLKLLKETPPFHTDVKIIYRDQINLKINPPKQDGYARIVVDPCISLKPHERGPEYEGAGTRSPALEGDAE